MAKHDMVITNKTDLLGFIYDPATLPTAIIDFGDGESPVSVHSLREGPESLLKQCAEYGQSNLDEDFEMKVWKFWDRYPKPAWTCAGMRFLKSASYEIGDIEQWATKSYEMCA